MVSVIIPIYNVSQYIERGMRYILAQDYSSFEVILVDDGSTDGSAQMCDEWARKDSRIIVIHKENAGAGSARNAGIDAAKGEYIYFFDIDDKVPSFLLSTLVSQIEKSMAEMMVFGYDSIDVKYKTTTRVQFNRQLIESNDSLRDVFVDEFILKVNGFPWNKMYKKSFLDKYNLRFENQRIQQDEVFNLMCYNHVSRLLLSDSVLYEYFVYDKGNTRSCFIPDRFDIYLSVNHHFKDLLYNHWQISDERLEKYLNKRFFVAVKQSLFFNLFHKKCPWSKNEKKREINRIVSEPVTQTCFAYMSDKKLLNLEDRLYMMSIPHLCKMQFVHKVCVFSRNVKSFLFAK